MSHRDDDSIRDPEAPSGLAEPDDPILGTRTVTRTIETATTDVFSDPEAPSGLAEPDDPTIFERSVRRTLTRRRARRAWRRIEVPAHLRANVGPSDGRERYSGFVIVRLTDPDLVPDRPGSTFLGLLADAVDKVLERLPAPDPTRRDCCWSQREDWAHFKKLIGGGLDAWRLIRSLGPNLIQDLEKIAQASALPPLHSLAAYWRLDLRGYPDGVVEWVVGLLNALPIVDLAYRELEATDPEDPMEPDQLYADAAPLGIGARWSWKQARGEGDGVTLVDLEQGWILNHQEFPAVARLYGDNRPNHDADYLGNHGTAVLGEVVAQRDARGVVGIAPNATAKAVSHYHGPDSERQPPDTNGHVADAVVAAILHLRLRPGALQSWQNGTLPRLGPGTFKSGGGDLILVEVQRGFKPAEVDHADFDALRLASALENIVIAAAGNGAHDLDAYVDETGARILDRAGAGFRESGAVMVAAAESELPHNRAWFSNFGSRLDCYAWGTDVVTCGYGDLANSNAPKKSYTHTFAGTSAAAPIVAGAAAAVQGIYRRAGVAPFLSPRQMRALLSNPAAGTPQGPDVRGHIGVMPNIETIVGSLRLLPDVYLRGSVADAGLESRSPDRSSSPDIIVWPQEEANPDQKFGEGSGSENIASLDAGLKAGQTSYIYLRARNSGWGEATEVSARIYWSEISTLITPDMWQPVNGANANSVSLGAVPPGDRLVVSPKPLLWTKSTAPACLVALLDSAVPAPEAPGSAWEEFLSNNRQHAKRNVVSVASVAAGGGLPAFLVAGAFDRARHFELEILQRLPGNATVDLEVPRQLSESLRRRLALRRRSGNRFRLAPFPRLSLGRVRLSAAARHQCKLFVTGAQLGHSIAVRQLYRSEEVGRVTFRFI